MIPWIPLVTSVLVGPLPVGPAIAIGGSASAPASIDEVRLEIDHSGLLEQQMAPAAEDSAFFVRSDGTKALSEQHGVVVVSDQDAPAIIVTLAWKDYENSVYAIELATERPGEPAQVLESFEATCINNSALTAVVLEKLPAALQQLAVPPAQPPPAADDTQHDGNEPRESDDTANPVSDASTRQPLGALGKAGIGLLAGGVAGLVGGGVVLALDRRYDQDGVENADWEGRDFRPPGVAVMVTGGALAATGVVLLIADRMRARRATDASEPSARLAPTLRGVALRGRF